MWVGSYPAWDQSLAIVIPALAVFPELWPVTVSAVRPKAVPAGIVTLVAGTFPAAVVFAVASFVPARAMVTVSALPYPLPDAVSWTVGATN